MANLKLPLSIGIEVVGCTRGNCKEFNLKVGGNESGASNWD